jgi:hypothetical protein
MFLMINGMFRFTSGRFTGQNHRPITHLHQQIVFKHLYKLVKKILKK